MHGRFVDSHGQGWYLTGENAATVYTADFGNPPPAGSQTSFRNRDLTPRPFEQLEADRGPLRPVEAMTDEDRHVLTAALSSAGRKAVTTVAAAVEQLYYEKREQHGGLDSPGSHDHAAAALTAGRGGSWESDLLRSWIIPFGNSLNLAKPSKERADNTIATLRAAGPSKRVDQAARTEILNVLRRWVTDPTSYTEVAANLAAVVSSLADQVGGWTAVADQWLQPTSLAHDDFVACYRLFYSLSADYDFAVA